MPKTKPIAKKPAEPLQLNVGNESDGWTFALEPRSQQRIDAAFPHARPGTSRVFIAYQQKGDFEKCFRPVWEHTLRILTGLDTEQLRNLGGFRIYDPYAESFIWRWPR